VAKATKRTPDAPSELLKGWQQIAAFLGQPVSVAQRWAASGMPVEKRGRFVYSSREQLHGWLGRESAGEPVRITTEETDLGAELKRGLSLLRKQTRRPTSKRAASARGPVRLRD
jgi:hypothetical protein